MTFGDKNTIQWHTTFGYVVRTIVPSLLLEYGLHEARVRRLPILVELRDLLAQLSLPLGVQVRRGRAHPGPEHVLPRVCG